MRLIKAIIIDDERLARAALKQKLQNIKQVKILAEADSVDSAIEQINVHHPDLLFLDIQLYNETGFDLLEKIDFQGQIIFVTAYDSYAIRAFEINALDYLLKPVTEERLINSLKRLGLQKKQSLKEQPLNYDDKIALTNRGYLKLVPLFEISCIKASGDFSIVLNNSNLKFLSNFTMSRWEKVLPEQQFIRIHRSTIVNIAYIEKVEPHVNFTLLIHLKNIDEPVKLSRSYRRSFKSRFKMQ